MADLRPSWTKELIQLRIETSISVKRNLLEQAQLLGQVAAAITNAFMRGNKMLLFGNGGSAADAQHLAAEFIGRYRLDRKPLPAIALTTNTSSLTAIGNDYAFDQVFARQVEALGNPYDIAVGISTSGSSANVIEGIRAAKRKNLITVGMTGIDGGRLKNEVDYCIRAPSNDTPRIQEAHIFVGHVLCEIVECALFGDSNDGRKSCLS